MTQRNLEHLLDLAETPPAERLVGSAYWSASGSHDAICDALNWICEHPEAERSEIVGGLAELAAQYRERMARHR